MGFYICFFGVRRRGVLGLYFFYIRYIFVIEVGFLDYVMGGAFV